MELTSAVDIPAPFQYTIEFATKPEPFTVSENPGPAVAAEFGLIDINEIGGFTPVPERLTLNGAAVLAPIVARNSTRLGPWDES